MKQIVTFTAIITVSILLINCTSTKNNSYNLPNGITEDDSAKEKFIKQFNEGKILYKINCAKCHSTTVNGKEVVPDFTLDQLTNYEIRMQNPRHEEDLRETNITQEELEKVILFFSYKKRNPVAQNK